MNSWAESLFPGNSSGALRPAHRLPRLRKQVRELRRMLGDNPFALMAMGSALIAAHLLVIIFQPTPADVYTYLIDAVASAICSVILLAHARSAIGKLSLRWYLLAFGFGTHAFTYVRGAIGQATGFDVPWLNVTCQALSSAFFILALTLPSEEQRKDERILDCSIAVVFCVLRILFLQVVVPEGSAHNLERMCMEAGVRALLACIALLAAPSIERTFFRSASVSMILLFFGQVCTNEIGLSLLHQQDNSVWALTDTVTRIACAAYFLYAFSRRGARIETSHNRAALSSVVPFTMTAFVVCLSASLLLSHPYIGSAGVALGVSAFLLRVGFMSRRRQPEIVIEEGLVREIASEIIKDPLYGLADRHGLEPALACARSAVGLATPLALILFAIEETGNGLEAVTEEGENRSIIMIARALNHWQTSDSTICYLGRGRFAMLLPSTPLRIAMSLAEQVCLSLDSLDLTGEQGPMAVMAGVAACTEPARVSGLLHTSSAALERAHVHREARVRCTPLRGEALFDA